MWPTAAADAPAADDPSAPPAELGEPVAEESGDGDVAFITPIKPLAPRMWGGISTAFKAGWIFNSGNPKARRLSKGQKKDNMEWKKELLPCSVKLKRTGSSRPFGNLVWGSLSSSKKVWAHASSGEIRAEGVYSKRRETKSIASNGVRARKT